MRGEDFRHFVSGKKALRCVTFFGFLKVEQLGCGAEALVGEECKSKLGVASVIPSEKAFSGVF